MISYKPPFSSLVGVFDIFLTNLATMVREFSLSLSGWRRGSGMMGWSLWWLEEWEEGMEGEEVVDRW